MREPIPNAASLDILLAEDNEFSSQFMTELLTGLGHRVRVAANGREALAMATEGRFDVLLLDVHMPELDGFEVAASIRRAEQGSGGHLPIVALTARSRKEDRDRCLAAGMDAFLTKPVGPVELFAKVDALLTATRGSPDLDPLLDPASVLSACGEDEETLRVMVRGFRDHLPARMATLRDALRAEDPPRLLDAARAMSEVLSAFSTSAADSASLVERLARKGQIDEARPEVEKLEATVERLLRLTAGLSLERIRRRASAP